MKNKNLRLATLGLVLFSLIPGFSQEFNKDFKSPSLDQLSSLSQGLKVDFQIPLPQFSEEQKTSRSTCQYPNEGIHSGNSIAPIISDKRRVEAILDLINRIAKCVKLPYKEDGQIFKNKEGKLPVMENGYYREYTLILPKDSLPQFYIGETQYTALPSLSARGPERIVIGGGSIIYYTPTHYASFIKLDIGGYKSAETSSSQLK
ncbi:MAG: hypothetical protein Fur0012_08810 [Elusimicrobiota bacterium]